MNFKLQEREEKERLALELNRSREEKERLLHQSKQAASQLRKFTALFLETTPEDLERAKENYTANRQKNIPNIFWNYGEWWLDQDAKLQTKTNCSFKRLLRVEKELTRFFHSSLSLVLEKKQKKRISKLSQSVDFFIWNNVYDLT